MCKGCGKKGHNQGYVKHLELVNDLPQLRILPSFVLVSACPKQLLRQRRVVFRSSIPVAQKVVSQDLVPKHQRRLKLSEGRDTMAYVSLTSVTRGYSFVAVPCKETTHEHTKLSVMQRLCFNVLLGHDFLQQNERVELLFGSDKRSPSAVLLQRK